MTPAARGLRLGLLKPGLRHDAHGDKIALLGLTLPGQAGVAEPQLGKTCRECVYWGEAGKHDRKKRWGVLKPQPCMKRRTLGHRLGSKIPHDQTACRHFEPDPTAPPECGP